LATACLAHPDPVVVVITARIPVCIATESRRSWVLTEGSANGLHDMPNLLICASRARKWTIASSFFVERRMMIREAYYISNLKGIQQRFVRWGS
jgi:hypothetical protein